MHQDIHVSQGDIHRLSIYLPGPWGENFLKTDVIYNSKNQTVGKNHIDQLPESLFLLSKIKYMNLLKKTLIGLVLLVLTIAAKADEGMWL